MHIRRNLVVIAAAGAMMLSACSTGSDSNNSNKNTSTNTTSSGGGSATKTSDIRIDVITHGASSDSFWSVVKAGAGRPAPTSASTCSTRATPMWVSRAR